MKLCMISLGCDKNLVDSEMMLGFLNRGTVSITDDAESADIIIVNTCCFILDAKDESIQTILDAARLKQEGKLKLLIMSGCMAERYKDEIMREIPEIDAVVGTSSYDKIGEVIEQALAGERVEEFQDLNRLPAVSEKRLFSTLHAYAYLKIAEGCDKHCSYCIIPSLRGHFRSYPMETLVAQAEQMAAAGVKELILVAQETTVYGQDIYKKKKLPSLLRKLCRIKGIRWIRILYCYPEEITDELIACMAKEKKICRYLDLPIQHASDPILRRMGRRTSRQDLLNIIEKLRTAMPDITLRTTLISGFPGETEEDHQTLMDFVSEVRFDRLGVFPYSREEGTAAAKFPAQIPARTKKKRRNQLMALQQKISAEKLQTRVGECMTALVEGYLPDEGVYIGRSYMDAPDVDGYLFFSSERELISGEFVKVRITEASEYDLKGVMV